MINADRFLNKLPDDLINKIYAKINYPQNPELLNEIKLFHYIKNKLVYDYGLYNICCCAMIQTKYDNESITIKDINYIHDIVTNKDDESKNKMLIKMIGKMPLKDKYSFIFHVKDKTIKPYVEDFDSYIKYTIDNIIFRYCQ